MRKAVEAAQGLRERKKARTREAIIEAALDLFERKGYDATTVEDIAAAAEVSPRTFFRYFESKLDLIMARSGEKHAGLGLLLADRPAGEGLVEAVREAMRAELAAQLDDPLVRREFQVMLTTPSLRNLAREHFYEEEAEMVPAVAERLRALLHRSPREFGQATSVWTLELAADVAYAEGITTTRVSDETVRATLARLGIRWRRAKVWITSPDPAYTQKKRAATG